MVGCCVEFGDGELMEFVGFECGECVDDDWCCVDGVVLIDFFDVVKCE